MAKRRLTLERARQLLRYCEATGCLYWRVGRGHLAAGREAGKPVCCFGKRYKRVVIDGYEYRVHRVVWLLVYGHFPTNEIDHIDGDGLNNRIRNLRDVPHIENGKNQRRQCNNTSGVNGVSWRKDMQRWRCRIYVNGKEISLGFYETLGEAANARKEAEKRFGFHQNHGSDRPL